MKITANTQRMIRNIFFVNIGLIAAMHLISQWLRDAYAMDPYWIDFSDRFNVDEEVSFPTWYSSSLLLLISLYSFKIAAKAKQHMKHWRVFATVLLLMSIDEAVSGHELFTAPLRDVFDIEGPSIIFNAWVVIGVVVVAVLGFMLGRFVQVIDRETRKLLIMGFAFYVAAVIFVEALGGLVVNNDVVYRTYVVLIEEVFELIGASLIALAVLGAGSRLK